MKKRIFAVAGAILTLALALFALAACSADPVVSFDPKGGSYSEPVVLDGSEKTLPAPTRPDYAFEGWFFDDETFQKPLTGQTLSDGTITENTTVFAKWKRTGFLLSFDPNGGTYLAPFKLDGTEKTFPVPTKAGFRFLGWYFDPAFESQAADALFTDGSISEDTTVFAKWEKITYRLSFDPNGGSECAPVTADGSEKTLPAPTREGYEFRGWYYDAALTSPVRAIDLLNGSIAADLTVYAKWTQNVFTVTLSVDGNEDRTVKAERNGTIAEPLWTTDEGYAFDGWYRDAALAEAYDFSAPVTENFRIYGTVAAETDAALFTTEDAADYGLTGVAITGVAENAVLPENLVLPNNIGGADVTVVLFDAFAKRTALKSVYLPDTVTVVAQGAFSGCASLRRVRMSKAISEVGDGAFYDTALYNEAPNGYFYVDTVLADFKGAIPDDFEVAVREGTRVIADRVFWTSKRVIKVSLPASLVYVGFNAFLQNPISAYSVPDENENYAVRDGVLYSKDLTRLVYYPVGSTRTSWTAPDTVESIGDEAFCNLYHLERLTLPDSVKTIGDGVFDMSVTLREIEFGAGVERVGDGVLHSQNALADIVVKTPAPFSFGVYFLTGTGKNYTIYIADEYYDAYLADANWKIAAPRMKKLSEKTN